MKCRREFLLGAIAGVVLATATPLSAAARVELELIADSSGGAALAFQEWMQTLGRAGVKNIRLRTAEATDRVGIETRGSTDNPVYVVTGTVVSRDELLLPCGRFKRSDAARAAQWLDDLAERGPPNRREAHPAFGLTASQIQRVREDLAKPVVFSTQGMTRSEAVEKIGSRLAIPIQVAGRLAAAGDDKVAEELSGVSCGTALACVLRPLGYGLVPRPTAEGLAYGVGKARLDQEVWPIGWPPEKPLVQTMPSLFEFHNVNVQNVAATKALEAIATRLKVPVLMDYNAMARHGVDPAKTLVSLPSARTTYSLALRKLLFHARLKFEVRVDEAGKPFLWITTVKPV